MNEAPWIPQHFITRLAGMLANSRVNWWKNWAIRYFIKRYQIDLQIAAETDIASYPNFNAFFTRHLKPNARPIVAEKNHIVCPADGCISQVGKIRNDLIIQAKGFYFNLSALLGGSETYARAFFDGSFITIYLAPKDYHRVHMPLSGRLIETIYVPGKLFSVGPETVRTVPQLFARNERLISIFDTELGPMAIILVGAIIVGNIHTVWPMKLNHKMAHQNYLHNEVLLGRGEEMGHFSLGSTVITLFPKSTMEWASDLKLGSRAQMGQSLGTLLGQNMA